MTDGSVQSKPLATPGSTAWPCTRLSSQPLVQHVAPQMTGRVMGSGSSTGSAGTVEIPMAKVLEHGGFQHRPSASLSQPWTPAGARPAPVGFPLHVMTRWSGDGGHVDGEEEMDCLTRANPHRPQPHLRQSTPLPDSFTRHRRYLTTLIPHRCLSPSSIALSTHLLTLLCLPFPPHSITRCLATLTTTAGLFPSLSASPSPTRRLS